MAEKGDSNKKKGESLTRSCHLKGIRCRTKGKEKNRIGKKQDIGYRKKTRGHGATNGEKEITYHALDKENARTLL